MTISVVQSAQAAPGGGPATFVYTLGSAPTAGNTIVLCTGAAGDGIIAAVVDNQAGNVWQRGPHAVDSGSSGFHALAECWYVPSVAYQSGTYTVTATPSIPASGANPGGFLLEVSGLDPSTPLDQQGTAADVAAGNTQLTVTASGANTNAAALVVTLIVKPSDAVDFAAGPTTGYTSKAVFNGNTSGVSSTGGYKVVSSPETSSAVSPTWITANYAAGVIATFKVASGGTAITPTVGAITLAGVAPTVTKPTVTKPAVLVGTVALAGVAPAVTKPTVTLGSPTVGSLSLVGIQPVQTLGAPSPGTAPLTLSGNASSIKVGATIAPSAGVLTTVGIAPSLGLGISPTAGAVTEAGVAVTLGIRVAPTVGALTINGIAATLRLGISPNAGSLSTVGAASALGLGIAPAAGSLAINSVAATLAIRVSPGAGSLAVNGVAGTLGAGIGIAPSAGSLSLGGIAVIQSKGLISASGALSATGNAASLGIAMLPPSGALVATGQLPSLGSQGLITPSAGSIITVGVGARADQGFALSAGQLTLNGTQPILIQAIPIATATGLLTLTGAAPAFGNAVIAPATAEMTLVGAGLASNVALTPAAGRMTILGTRVVPLTGYTILGLYLRPLPAPLIRAKEEVY